MICVAVFLLNINMVAGLVLATPAASAAELQVLDGREREQVMIRETRSGHLDIFNRDGRREGCGVQRPDGSWDLYNEDSSRFGILQPRDRRLTPPPDPPAAEAVAVRAWPYDHRCSHC